MRKPGRCGPAGAALRSISREASCPRVTVPPGATSPGERRVAMFPHTMGRWWSAHRHGCGEGFMHGGRGHGMHGGGGDDGGVFGVRRPLRYLAYRLALDERQT